MDSHVLIDLLKKYRQGSCSEEELEQLNRWYDDFDIQVDQIPAVPEEKLEILWNGIEQRLDQRMHKIHRLKWWHYTVRVAAAVFLVLGGTWYFTFQIFPSTPTEKSILPGYRHAQLQLSDGSVIELDSSTVVREVDGALVEKDSSYVLDYSTLRVAANSATNTIQVPIGGEYGLRLSDGTLVWMNSGSSLKFPVRFQGEKREVVLSGEAYFEVTKSSVPFIVKTSEFDIKVLGTSFNVSAYEDDEAASATLVQGSVEVYEHHNRQTFRIVPGNTLAYQKRSKEVTIGNPDTGIYTSWIKGEFKFRDMRLEEIMTKLNRWYDCTIRYDDPALKELRFSGAAEKDRPVNYLLEMIETITDVRFRIDGNQIIVMHK